MIRIVQERLLDRAEESPSSLSERFKMTQQAMSKLIREDLRYTSYTGEIRRELSDEEKRLRADRSLEISIYSRTNAHHRLRFFCGKGDIHCGSNDQMRPLAFDPADVPRRPSREKGIHHYK